MITVEDRARAAMRAIAGTVNDAPPLRLAEMPKSPGQGLVRLRWGGLDGTRRRGGWLAPLAAVVVVLAVALSLIVVKTIQGSGPGLVTGPVPVVSGVPRYYVALDNVASGNLVIGDTFTGKRLAVVDSPTGQNFSGITAAADDSTFVVTTSTGGAANPGTPRTWYLLRLRPETKPGYQLTRLPIPVLTNVTIDAIALSGSGAELAVALAAGKVPANASTTLEIRIYSVATGQLLRRWSTSAAAAGSQSVFGVGAGMFGEQNRALTWADDDRTLLFPVMWLTRNRVPDTNQQFTTMRRLDVSSGGDLMRASRVIWTSKSSVLAEYPPGCAWGSNPLVSADGETIICVSVFGPPLDRAASPKEVVTWKFSWQAYAVAAPTVAHDVYQFTVRAPRSGAGSINEMWTNTAGDTALVYWYIGNVYGSIGTAAPGSGATARGLHFGEISGGRFRPLPIPAGLDVGDGPPSTTW